MGNLIYLKGQSLPKYNLIYTNLIMTIFKRPGIPCWLDKKNFSGHHVVVMLRDLSLICFDQALT